MSFRFAPIFKKILNFIRHIKVESRARGGNRFHHASSFVGCKQLFCKCFSLSMIDLGMVGHKKTILQQHFERAWSLTQIAG